MDFSAYIAKFVRESEEEYEELERTFPHIVDTSHLLYYDEPDDYKFSLQVSKVTDRILGLLYELDVPEKDYVAFPSTSGKYANKSNCILFKNANDAIMFKLVL